ncbi:glycosyltransferase [Pseudarthrobacter sp. BIM B-2242]|uniref:glycosyltransferase n=1 Tax=Pseudarthrobacter sp. BIM B-2242 TaxID=2772401 RepID=UPI00168C0400|nr:glycosyltransferase [Pseudarthrobacter sp. BIM B-2242]QOD02637.1 glycosyltransferase [Pseudarthrobacter sp. BIM B-2242]
MNYGLDSHFGNVVYHSVDLLHTIPGIPTAALLAAEKELVRAAEVVIASSQGVKQHLDSLGAPDVVLWENVASVELFSGTKNDRLRRAIFAGNLTPTKVQAELLLDLAESGVKVALAGPINIDGTPLSGALSSVLNHPFVDYLGNLELAELAVEFSKSKVGLIPYHINEYTAGVFPMKVYEYLASGLSVVSTPLPSLKERQISGLHLADNKEAFIEKVLHELGIFTEEQAEVRTLDASDHSWTRRTEEAERLLTGLLGPHKPERGNI